MSRYVCYEDVGKMALSMMGINNSEWLQVLQGLPSIEIVRCEECKHWTYEEVCRLFYKPRCFDDFCSYGERTE